MHEPGYHSGSGASTRSSQYNCRSRIPSNNGPIRLDVESQDLEQDPAEMWSTRSGHVCIQTDNSAEVVASYSGLYEEGEVKHINVPPLPILMVTKTESYFIA